MKTKNYKIYIILPFLLFSVGIFSQVGINTITPMSTLDINGNLSVKTVSLIGTNTGGSGTAVLINDGVYISIMPIQTDDKFELPNPTLFPGRIYIIRNISNTITAKLTTVAAAIFAKNSTSGGASEIYMFENNRRTIIIVSDGFNWTYFD